MLKRKQKWLVIIAILLTALSIYLFSIDLTPIPKSRIGNIDSSTVAQIPCQKEVELNETTIVGGMGPNSPFKKAVDRALVHNSPEVTAEYELELGFSAKAYCKDIIFMDTHQPGQTLLSVKCKRKDDTHAWNSSVSSLFGFSRYNRDYGREYVIMVETVKQLQAEHQAKVEWLGRWRPENSKAQWPDIPGTPSYLPTPPSQANNLTPNETKKRDIELSEMNLYHIKEMYKLAAQQPYQLMKDHFHLRLRKT